MSHDPWTPSILDLEAISKRGVVPLIDKRHLHILSRKERQLWKKWLSGGSTVVLNLLERVEAIGHEEKIITSTDNQPPTLKSLILRALRTPINSDQAQGFKEKNERYLVVKRVDAVDEIELTEGEVKLIKDRAGRIFMDVGIVGRMGELLDGVTA